MDFGSSSRFPDENQEHDSRRRDEEEMESRCVFIEKEHMFDKVVTPSDVGKLNRLVIPKQHAEKFFPLDSSSSNDVKGVVLSFEDGGGKSWRFRYSYWTSSQSYVMTKGWSRFVKDKTLDAGDIVSFHRALIPHLSKDRFFIDCRRRPPHAAVHTADVSFHHGGPHPHPHFHLHMPTPSLSLHRDHFLNSSVSLIHNHNPYYNNSPHPHPHPHPHHNHTEFSVYHHLTSVPPPLPSPPLEAVSVPVVADGSGGVVAKSTTLRLFGVDMECAVSEVRSDDECDVTMSPPFRVYNGMPMSMPMSMHMSSRDDIPTMDFFDKGNSRSMLDFGT